MGLHGDLPYITLYEFVTLCELEHGPVEIERFPGYKMVDLSIVVLVVYQRVMTYSNITMIIVE